MNFYELMLIPKFEDRVKALMIGGTIGIETFGGHRQLNQIFYTSPEWRRFRRQIILRDSYGRDNCMDLSCEGWPINGRIYIHHIVPITVDDVINRSPALMDPNNVVCCSDATHRAIHYGDLSALRAMMPVERFPNDTSPWLQEGNNGKSEHSWLDEADALWKRGSSC